MKAINTVLFVLLCLIGYSQGSSIKGQLIDNEGQALMFANVSLYTLQDSSLYKVETSDEAGVFRLRGINAGEYYLHTSYVGSQDLYIPDIALKNNEDKDLGILTMQPSSVILEDLSARILANQLQKKKIKQL